MGSKLADEVLSTVRAILGSEHSDMDIIRALHMANNDTTAAINIMLDTPSFKKASKPQIQRAPEQRNNMSSSNGGLLIADSKPNGKENVNCNPGSKSSNTLSRSSLGSREIVQVVEEPSGCPRLGGREWWLVGCGEVAGLSTCKGKKIKPGDEVVFTFPLKNKTNSPSPGKFPIRGRHVAACSEIVRFYTEESGEIGRIPTEWARCLLPLVRDNRVKIEGCCKFAPGALEIMDTILLSVSVYINISMFQKCHQISFKVASQSSDATVSHPLQTLFRLLGLIPFKKAELTPCDLYSRKRPLYSKDHSVSPMVFEDKKSKHASLAKSEVENEEAISDAAIDKIVGVYDNPEIEEMDTPSALQCELHPYQKQALFWMVQLEKGGRMDEDATTLHPCWEAYRLTDKRELVVYLNVFSGEATTEFPSTLQMARGGILADSMGLGKTIMTIALLLADGERIGQSGSEATMERSSIEKEMTIISGQSSKLQKKSTVVSHFDKLMKQKAALTDGVNLIVCPMTLLGQWKSEIESHVQPGSLSIYIHYGQSRQKDAKIFAHSDVVITTYGVLASEYQAESAEDNGSLYSVRWFRVVLDEAHTIKSSKSQVSMAAAALVADCRWCLTGTPIQNNLEDLFSLLRFLKVEPWGNWGWWNKLIQKPFEEGDERGLKLLQSVLKSIMLRRTKLSTDREGRPILALPPVDVQVIYCELTAAEKDFYDALFNKSKVKFDKFVEQGRVLHNYASILELLLRLRQCCDHPFLVMSRGDAQEFSDLNKLAKRFLRSTEDVHEEQAKNVLSRAYIQEVVEELQKGEHGECPICLEAFEDAVLTPCAHRLCRECLLASWRTPVSGLCPVCRKTISRQELITAPTNSRFQIDIDKNWVESSKVTLLLRELEDLQPSGSKSIVFSQWTAFLDLLQIPLSRRKISFVRLDGTLNQQQREKVIKQFSEEHDILVLLMSLKAGGVGINLTEASNAFVMDPWWNPAVEEQAVMRIHRIGQTKSVVVKRFILKGTVEERMEAVQARKQRMISGALTDQEVRTARIEELKMLFT